MSSVGLDSKSWWCWQI